jgi:hypothetical protein
MFNRFYCLFKNILIFGSLLASIGAIVYRVYSLNITGVAISLVLTMIAFIFILKRSEKSCDRSTFRKVSRDEKGGLVELKYFLSYIFYLIATLHCFYILFTHQTTDGIISPWQVLPSSFFTVYALTTLLLIFNIVQKKKYALVLIIIHYFLSFSIALIVYKIGFGFDPFVHRATMDLINKTGSVDPKPFYYLGQYALTIILHKIFFIKLEILDKLLVPVMASIYIPIFLFSLLKRWFQDNVKVNLLILALLVLPFSFFTVTTPQSLAYLLLLLVIILGLDCNKMSDIFLLGLLSFTALLIQPIAGIPALFLTILITIFHSDNKKLKTYLYIIFATLASLAIPTALILSGKMNNSGKIFNLSNIKEIFDFIVLQNPSTENVLLNLAYLFIFNLKAILIFLIFIGLISAWKHREDCKIFLAYFISAAAFYISYFLTKLINFDSLIDYERSNYTDRILTISIFFLLPFIVTALYSIIVSASESSRATRRIVTIFLVVLLTTSLFANYPRIDNYHNSHGYSVSAHDLEAVSWIAENKINNEYIVLANQQVSAGALYKYGFAKYYKDNIFYYPIPTGGEMYQYYLDMVYRGAQDEHMKKAMDLAGVSEAYFVLNKYWWAFPKILDEAKSSADSWETLGEGEIFVFRYTK